jgi:protocatechuate 3,4-dioxygenase beta subunit
LISLHGCTQGTSRNVNQPGPADIKVGASCEDCEAIYESPVPFNQLNAIDTLADFLDKGPKLHVSGIIFQKDGKTPAPNVVMYFYHTDQSGIYPKRGNEKGIDRKHGYLRGWVRTDQKGHYSFFTLVPASYPNSNNPKHIHAIIKEPGKSEYWIDEFLFADDPLLPPAEKARAQPVGGQGVLKTAMKDGLLEARRDIILGLNVRNYPSK